MVLTHNAGGKEFKMISFKEVKEQVSLKLAQKERWPVIIKAIEVLTGSPSDKITLSEVTYHPFLELSLGELGEKGKENFPDRLSIKSWEIQTIPKNRQERTDGVWSRFEETACFTGRNQMYTEVLREWVEKNKDCAWIRWRSPESDDYRTEVLVSLGISYDESSDYALLVELVNLYKDDC